MDTLAFDYLLRLASLSVAFVAFATIVVTLRRGLGGELSTYQTFLVRSYIEIQLAVAVAALLPSLLNLFALPGALIWRVSSGVLGTLAPGILVGFVRRRARVGRKPTATREYVVYVLSLIVVAGLWLDVAGLALAPGGGAYAVALTWFLFSTGFIFVRELDDLFAGKRS